MSATKPIKIPQEAFDWYDEYAHGDIDRRRFMARLATLTGVGLSMSVLTGALMPDYALAEQVSFNDPDILASYQTFASPDGHLEGRGYLVRPGKREGKGPAVLVAHENRGLNPYIEDVARRLAKRGYLAFAPDALHSLGGYPGNDDAGKEMQRSLERARIEQDFIAAAKFLHDHELGNGKLGVVGFCFGGYITNMLAATLPDLVDAAVPFYGTPAQADVVGNIRGPLMLQFAELDQRVNATWPDYEKLLQQKKVTYQAFVYPGVQHGFHNDSTGRYDEAAAELAWSRTLEFFAKHLS
ncbi:MAG: dienelactone hydrolase family protein [Gammaproteobacteria bacterium]|nr:dienelactone hydrolase family protein [Gammaproteobacteria bacterium]MDH3535258.1 dienelactone hydrolase family protein [Gammaproteobacteria bacterium]